MRILIAEDQPELRRMLVKNLTAVGYTVDGYRTARRRWRIWTRPPMTRRCWTS